MRFVLPLLALAGPLHAQPAGVAAFGARCDGVADDSPALARAADAARDTGQVILVPGGCRLRLGGAAAVWLRGTGLAGEGVHGFDLGQPAEPARSGRQGSTILIDTDAFPPFTVSNDWSITGLTFIWPRQTESAAAARGGQPIPFPPLLAAHGTDGAYGWTFAGNVVRNAFDILDLSAAGGAGHGRVSGNSIFALRYAMRFRQADGEVFISDNQVSPAAAANGLLGGPTRHLAAYAASHAEMIRVEGDGTPARQSSQRVEGQHLSNNYMYLGRHGLHVVGGAYNLATWSGTSFDQVASAITVEAGGAVIEATVTGGTWLCQHFGDNDATAPCIGIEGGAPGSTLSLANVSIPVTMGPAIRFIDPGAGSLSVSGSRIAHVGNTTAGGPHHGIVSAARTGTLANSGTTLASSPEARPTAQARAQGIVVGAALATTLSGLVLSNWDVPVVFNTTEGRHAVTGSISTGSPPDNPNAAVLGPGTARVVQAGNSWDQGSR